MTPSPRKAAELVYHSRRWPLNIYSLLFYFISISKSISLDVLYTDVLEMDLM